MTQIEAHPWMSLYGLLFGVPSFLLGLGWAVTGLTVFTMMMIVGLSNSAPQSFNVNGLWFALPVLLAVGGVIGLSALYRMTLVWLKSKPLSSLRPRWWIASLVGLVASFIASLWLAFGAGDSSSTLLDGIFRSFSVGLPLWPILAFFWRLRLQPTSNLAVG